jgi:hypothetical protein
MQRRVRMYVSGLLYHVVRGNNRQACFIEPENYQLYLVLWEELSRRYGLSVHAPHDQPCAFSGDAGAGHSGFPTP